MDKLKFILNNEQKMALQLALESGPGTGHVPDGIPEDAWKQFVEDYNKEYTTLNTHVLLECNHALSFHVYEYVSCQLQHDSSNVILSREFIENTFNAINDEEDEYDFSIVPKCYTDIRDKKLYIALDEVGRLLKIPCKIQKQANDFVMIFE